MFLQLFLFFLFAFLLFKLNRRDKNLPPGQWGLPLVGVVPFSGRNLRQYFHKVKHKYGNIFYLKCGSRIVVFVRDFEIIKKHFNRSELAIRPELFTLALFRFFQHIGILFSNGSIWENNRRFALRHLRDFGLGKSNKMQDIIHREARAVVDSLGANLGQPVEVDYSLNVAVVNVIWGLVAGERFDPKDTRLMDFAEALSHDVANFIGPATLLDFFPILMRILPNFVKNRWMKVDTMLKNRMNSKIFLKEIIEEHRRTLDRNNPRDYIDAYLIELEERKETKITFKDPIMNLVSNVHDMFNAGMDTTSTTMKWFILYMAVHPHVQKRLQEELDSALPRGQLPLLDDKDRLPYLHATIYETMRHCTLAPFSGIHSNEAEVQIENYRLPKGSMIFTCIEECHHDPKYWEKPEEFYPGHFLDGNGQFKMRTESFLPFGYGKRLCLGESVARMEVFMFAGAIVQSYHISLPEGAKVNLEPDSSSFVVSYPLPYKVIFEKRM